ncbi:MAG: type II toxin-antitoxin system RelE/ParE family toxin [Alphaproteobacteria bacterium]|nr:type II toxin-antitoxin system RelE/ParE family toxin [Alphaproteobacteria bacterium]
MTLEMGWPAGMPLCRSLKGHKGLWEIRCQLEAWTDRQGVFLCPSRASGLGCCGFEKKRMKGLKNDGC